MPTYPPALPSRRRQRAAWPRSIILVIILVFVIGMTALGYAPEAAAIPLAHLDSMRRMSVTSWGSTLRRCHLASVLHGQSQ